MYQNPDTKVVIPVSIISPIGDDTDTNTDSLPDRADLAEVALRVVKHFDDLRPTQVAAHVRALLRLYRFDTRTLPESAALAGCSRSTLLRAQTILTRLIER